MKAKDNSIFQVVAESYEEKELEVQIYRLREMPTNRLN